MKSHTVPRKLLEQFSYFNAAVRAPRLWRYQRGMEPFGRATLKTATMIDGHFVDPRDSAKEAELETRLAQEFEQPVNQYLDHLGFKTFVFSNKHVRELTAYISLLFHRSKARRAGTQQQLDITVAGFQSILDDEQKLAEIAATWTLHAQLDGVNLPRRIMSQDVRQVVTKTMTEELASDALQHSYAGTMERAMAALDSGFLNGQWGVIHSEPNDPFVLGDAPVVTWVRYENNFRSLAEGFGKPDVEVFLPISPIACLHVLPAVQRTRAVMRPSTLEINTAQASFASDYCYTSQRNDVLDGFLQPAFGTIRIGINGFSIRYKDYNKTIFETLLAGRGGYRVD